MLRMGFWDLSAFPGSAALIARELFLQKKRGDLRERIRNIP
jgi:hypothetical protein